MQNEVMTTNSLDTNISEQKQGLRWSHVLWIILATIVITAGATYWAVRTYVFAKDFEPVVLKQKEVLVLNRKLEQLGFTTETEGPASTDKQTGTNSTPASEFNAEGNLKPQVYSEVGAKREVSLSERELNSLLAKNTDLARKLAIDLSDDLMSAKLLVPVDPDFPVLGGKTLRVTGGLEVAYDNDKPIVVLRGVSIMGVPVPNAWLGGMKNIDLVKEFSTSEGFWKAFADGIQNIHVEDGRLIIKLKE
ncbi:MAG: arginine N-succinyltransferase [Arenicellales bacterium]